MGRFDDLGASMELSNHTIDGSYVTNCNLIVDKSKGWGLRGGITSPLVKFFAHFKGKNGATFSFFSA